MNEIATECLRLSHVSQPANNTTVEVVDYTKKDGEREGEETMDDFWKWIVEGRLTDCVQLLNRPSSQSPPSLIRRAKRILVKKADSVVNGPQDHSQATIEEALKALTELGVVDSIEGVYEGCLLKALKADGETIEKVFKVGATLGVSRQMKTETIPKDKLLTVAIILNETNQSVQSADAMSLFDVWLSTMSTTPSTVAHLLTLSNRIAKETNFKGLPSEWLMRLQGKINIDQFVRLSEMRSLLTPILGCNEDEEGTIESSSSSPSPSLMSTGRFVPLGLPRVDRLF